MLQGFYDKNRVEGVAMAKHCGEVGRGSARRAGTSSLLTSAMRELQQGRHIRGSLRVVCDLARARIGSPLQHVDHFLVQGPPPCRRNRCFDRATGEFMTELQYPSFEGKHALLHARVESGVDRPFYQVGDDCSFRVAGEYRYRIEHDPRDVR